MTLIELKRSYTIAQEVRASNVDHLLLVSLSSDELQNDEILMKRNIKDNASIRCAWVGVSGNMCRLLKFPK